MKVFIDGMIFGWQRMGGISKVWEAYLNRFCAYDFDVQLLVPLRKKNPSLINILAQNRDYTITQDLLYWPARYFQRVPIRSKLIRGLYLDRDVDLFHSTFLSTVYSDHVKNIVTVHDLIPELFEQKQPNRWTALVLDMRRRVFENADHFIVISRHTRDDLLRCYPAILPEQVNLIYNGIAPHPLLTKEHTSLDRINEKYALRLDKEGYFLYVGNRNGYKNFKIIPAWLATQARCSDAHFVCVGGDEPTARLAEQLAAQGLTDHFTFIDFVSDEDLATLYYHAIALVYPSHYEGFGLPILEAMIHDCPVLASGTSCLPEIGGEAALYFDPDSPASLDAAIRQLGTMPRESMLASGRANATRFSWDRSTQQLVEVYKTLCDT